MLDDAGLVCCGWHTPIELLQEATIFPTIAYNKALGNDKLIVSWVNPEQYQRRDDWIELAKFSTGRLIPWRATAWRPASTTTMPNFCRWKEWPWYTLFDHAAPEVIMQFDTGNALAGNAGVDVVDVIRRYPGRARSVHLKPFAKSLAAKDPEAATRPAIGEDEIPWADFFDACESAGGVEWYIVEYESDAYPPLEAVRRCLQALRDMGK